MSTSDGFSEAINKKYGEGTLIRLSQQPNVRRIPTGITHLDANLGGGFPVGRISMIWGVKSSGKTTLCMHAIAQAQKLCRHDVRPLGDPADEDNSQIPIVAQFFNKHGKCVDEKDAMEGVKRVNDDMSETTIMMLKKGFTKSKVQEPMRTLLANQEGTIDTSWAADIGVDPDLVYCLNTENAEQTIDIVDAMMREGLVDLVIIDSIAAMTPSKESDETTEKWQQGLHARLVNKALRIWVATLNSFRDSPVRPTMILVNQVRTKIGVMYGSPDVKPGGVGQDFATAVEIKLSPSSPNKDPRKGAVDFADEDDGGHLLLVRTNYRIEKNKTYPPKGVGQYLMAVAPHDGFIRGTIIQIRQVMEMAKQAGQLEKDPKKGWILGGVKTFKTLKELQQWALNEPEEFDSFRRVLTDFLVDLRSGKTKP